MLQRMAARFAGAVCCFAACAAMAQSSEVPDLSALANRFARARIVTHGEERRFTRGFFFDADGKLTVQGTPLVTLISNAYQIQAYQVVDGPDWIRAADLYDIEAVAPPRELVQSDFTQMLRSLLRDRFKLELTATSREMPVLALEFVETRPDFRATDTPQFKWTPGQKEGLYIRGTSSGPGNPVNMDVELTLATVARSLSNELDRPVVDMTGLEGIWTTKFEGVVPGVGPGLKFSLLLERLGLRLTERAVTLDVLAITHVEHPTLDAD